MKYGLFAIFLLWCNVIIGQKQVNELELWKFSRLDLPLSFEKDFDDSNWETVQVPHDWAIYGPFDKEIDKQIVKIEQNIEKVATEKTGRTGALPFIGVGWYRTKFILADSLADDKVIISFDGAMSNAEVFVNGKKVGERPYGYSYFYFDITKFVNYGNENVVAVRLENKLFSSRWYPGAGLYRKVRVITKEKESFNHWGNFITTPEVFNDKAKVHISSLVEGNGLSVKAIIRDSIGVIVAENQTTGLNDDKIEQTISVNDPKLWSPENPYLYTVELNLYQGSVLKDSEIIRFGIRKIEYIPDSGFLLNGKVTKFKGVCLHHDLGPVGTAINRAALKRQLGILKNMGCNAIRSSHNMPSIEQLELCDEMGFLFLAESFDEWKKPKVQNGYNLYFDEWAEKDVVNLIQATRNHPCIVMWSAGNEVPDQWGDEGVVRLKWLQDIFHREDPTRPVTVGMDQVDAVMENGFGAILDIPGLNYRVHLYEEAYKKFPQRLLLGSETASTVSSRGIYKFPVVQGPGIVHDDLQCSSYDLEYCDWSNIPEDDFELQDDYKWVIGEFVWTGFDYVGEPTPYDNYWPSRSSYFGICDLAGLPKDRYYLYRSRWNNDSETLHILPHWNWEGREGEITPVFVYTSFNSAELFVNGISQGKQIKNDKSKLNRYRLMWNDIIYQPGTIKVIAFNENGEPVAERSINTAGEPYAIKLEADRSIINSNGDDLCFVTASIIDKNGNLCPTSAIPLKFDVTGNGSFRAACNGDPTSLELFHIPEMKTFSGKVVVILQPTEQSGNIELIVSGKGLKQQKIKIQTIK